MSMRNPFHFHRSIVTFKTAFVIGVLTAVMPAKGDVPASAYIDLSGIKENAYPAAVCYMASVGQLINFYDNTSTVAETMAMSGFCTEYAWVSTGRNHYVVDPHRYIYNMPLKLYAGQSLDLYQLSGLIYKVGYLRGGSANATVLANAQSTSVFGSQAEAVNRLKEVIAGGDPVQVHLDFQYIAEEAGVYYPFWQNCNEVSSHFVIIHGYDEQYVYYTDNNPTTGIDVDLDGESDGVGVPLSWSAFLDAWYYAGMINRTDKRIACGPYYMFYLTEAPARASSMQVLRHLHDRGANGAEVLRNAAAAIAVPGSNGESILRQWLRDRKGEMTPLMADYLEDAGLNDPADTYDQVAALWASIRDNPDWSEVPQTLVAIADLIEAYENEIGVLTADMPTIALLGTGGGAIALDEGPVFFRWACPLGRRTGSIVELAMKEDFADKGSVLRIKAPRHYTLAMTDALWLKALGKDDGNRQLLWRVVNGPEVSEEASFEWDPLEITLISPADGYEFSADENLSVTWEAPSFAHKLRLVFCNDDAFNNKKIMVAFNLRKGTDTVTIAARTIPKIKRYADADGWIYCRVEDGNFVHSTIAPSTAIRIKLP